MSNYYQPCEELTLCHALDCYWENKEYQKWFEGYLKIAIETEYALAQCQVGYAYLEGIGTDKDEKQAFYWTTCSAIHGDRDGQFNEGMMLENGIGTVKDIEQAKEWYLKAANQDHDLAIEKCQKEGWL